MPPVQEDSDKMTKACLLGGNEPSHHIVPPGPSPKKAFYAESCSQRKRPSLEQPREEAPSPGRWGILATLRRPGSRAAVAVGGNTLSMAHNHARLSGSCLRGPKAR